MENPIDTDLIIERTCEYLFVDVKEFAGNCRKADVVKARQFFCFYLYKRCKGFSYSKIGQMIGGKDHTTVLYHINQCIKFTKLEKQYKKELNRYLNIFTSETRLDYWVALKTEIQKQVSLYLNEKTSTNEFKQGMIRVIETSCFSIDAK